jgi:hypothetical protein
MKEIVVVVDAGGCAKFGGGDVGCRIAFTGALRPVFVLFYTPK